jgi:hypothetical protein
MKLPNDSARADLAVTTTATNLTGFLNIFKGQMSTERPTDQISRYLVPLVSLSVKLRPELVSGTKQFSVIVDFDISCAILPWPGQSIHTTVKNVDDQGDTIWDQIQGYAPLRPS